jgi:hypothetical protein
VTTFRKIADTGEIGPLLIKLMMAVNDLGIANNSLGQWIANPPFGHQDRVQGAKSYFVRLMVAHTFEALKVIYQINNNTDFKKFVGLCDRQTRETFARLVSIIGTKEYKTMKRIRNAITFHYETDAIAQAIERQSDKFPDHALSGPHQVYGFLTTAPNAVVEPSSSSSEASRRNRLAPLAPFRPR